MSEFKNEEVQKLPCYVVKAAKNINRKKKCPLYKQLYHSLYEALTIEEVIPGSFFATEYLLREATKLSRSTIRKAIDELVRGGHLVRITGQGTFTSVPNINLIIPELKSLTQELIDNKVKPGTIFLSAKWISVPEYLRKYLRKDKYILNVKRIRTGNGIPIMYSNSYLPFYTNVKETEDFNNSLYEILKYHNSNPAQAQHEIKATILNEEISEMLNTHEGSAGLFVTRKTFNEKGYLILYEEGIGSDNYHYSLNMESNVHF